MPDAQLADPRVPAPADVRFDAVDPRLRDRVLAAIGAVSDARTHEPAWSVSPLRGGASNLNFRVDRADGVYVLRLPGGHAERFGNTQAHGLAIQSAAAAAGIAPPVCAYHSPTGTSLVPFVAGEALGSDTVRVGDRLERVGLLLRRLHAAAPVEASWSAFADIRRYVAIAAAERLDLPPDATRLLSAVDRVEALLEGLPDGATFCHNDLQPQNVVDDGDRLWLIDWEYGGTGNRYFDLGNFAINVELTERELDRLLGAYLGDDTDGLPAVRARVALMRAVSAIREACWSVVAEPVLDTDWDYSAWAAAFFDRCRRAIANGDLDRWLEEATP